VIGLASSHREPVRRRHPSRGEVLGQQPILGPHVVGHGHDGRIVGGIRGARGHAVGEHVGHHDEPPGWVEHPVRADQPGQFLMIGGVTARVDDHVIPCGIKRPVGLPGQACVADHAAAFDRQIAELQHSILNWPHAGASSLHCSVAMILSLVRAAGRPGSHRQEPGGYLAGEILAAASGLQSEFWAAGPGGPRVTARASMVQAGRCAAGPRLRRKPTVEKDAQESSAVRFRR
jgi:hypothetical protein